MQLRHILMVTDNPHHIIMLGADAPPAAAHRHQPPRGMVVLVTHLVHGGVCNKFVMDGPKMGPGTGINPVHPEVEALGGGHFFTRTEQAQGHRIGKHGNVAGVSVDINDPKPHIGRSQGFAVPVLVAGRVFCSVFCGHNSPVFHCTIHSHFITPRQCRGGCRKQMARRVLGTVKIKNYVIATRLSHATLAGRRAGC